MDKSLTDQVKSLACPYKATWAPEVVWKAAIDAVGELLQQSHADEAIEACRKIARNHVGTEFPVPENEPPLWVQNRGVMADYEDRIKLLERRLRRYRKRERATAEAEAALKASEPLTAHAPDLLQACQFALACDEREGWLSGRVRRVLAEAVNRATGVQA